MRANYVVLLAVAAWCFLAGAVYIVWSLLDVGTVEWAGTTALLLTGVLAVFVAFFLWRSHRAQGGELPEDRLDANIDDGDPELGFFSPWSWWPIGLAASAALVFLGLAAGYWIAFVGVALFLVMIVGWVYEYYRGYFAR
ncbi:cytochrome c oxidase subunit 4 [Naasia sp. SYSU D00948]|uniref:cytochrome c oxidase subunit 4 n=1 Tax=Naasia sp. SYSU D00948 TaxID=2817379 RepID=UPI001B3138E9|nr:cytochrome c oxidase subunit 4 [Naasia sp. SYSU D00948]